MLADKEDLLALTQRYYKLWENKDLSGLKDMFSNDVVLIDPVVKKVEGIDAVLAVNSDIFNGCKTLKIIEKNVYVDCLSDTSIGEVKLLYDTKLIGVVDIILFDQARKISKIVAYLN